MSQTKRVREHAKSLLQLSLKEGSLDGKRVGAVLKALELHPPRRYRAILREYLRLVRREVAKGQAIVEYAGELPEGLLPKIQAEMSAQYRRPIEVITRENRDLIAGWRITVDSDVYEASIASSLEQLAKATAF